LKIRQISLEQCFEQIQAGDVLVCVNRRLARSLSGQYASFRQARGDRAWESPDILPYGAWLARWCADLAEDLWHKQSGGLPGLLLDEFQEQLIWEKIISESGAGAGLLDTRATARRVQEAWALCRQWKVVPGEGQHWQAPDPAVFATWAQGFEHLCKDAGFMDRAGLADCLAKAADDGRFVNVSGLILAGFDEIAPADRDLFEALFRRGIRVAALAAAQKRPDACHAGFEDDAAEMRAAAIWARNRVESDPDARIGVVCMNLAEERSRVLRVFEQVFYPSVPGFADPVEHPVFNISAPPMLVQYPAAAAACAILELARKQKADVAAWSRLLQSPFLAGSQNEYHFRAVVDAALREQGDFVVSVPRVASLARSLAGSGAPPVLSDLLQGLQQQARDLAENNAPEQWAKIFVQILDAAGWPGQRSLTSAEYQSVAAFRQALERFAKLYPAAGSLSFARARQIFVSMLHQIPFAPEQPEVPVQILGLLEAAGQEFEYLWIMGMHHEAWPPLARPNAFIPSAVSRSLGLPHCSPERELVRARQMTARLLGGADRVVCSWGQRDGDSPRLPSPLIAHLPEAGQQEFESENKFGTWISRAGPAELEKFWDISGAPVPAGAEVSGGTGIFRFQAVCPFQAYGRYRLGARGLEMPAPGLNARDRGNLVHYALERLWRRIADSQALVDMDEAGLAVYIQEAVTGAVDKMAAHMPETFTPGFCRVETDRLAGLLAEWINQEKNRTRFFVDALESRIHVSVGDMSIRTFADRIDRLEDGRQIIIDYKTGSPSANDWFTDRIAEPQLPLYSLAIGSEKLAGVLFARVKKAKCAYLGIVASEGLVDGIGCVADDNKLAPDAGSMAEVLSGWEQGLSELAKEIASGHAPVSPQSVNKTCRYCDLQGLCRILEAGRENQAGAEGVQ
jgi:probable DNA repair protein